ncbi:MAG TPA: DUF5979 domain-containing protein [Solirubrobacteraceae bacterium]|nr:DUF5979 domain-containing protein [Solirubrobacteraceae bacterium]
MVLTGLGPGQSVSGFIADADNPFDPVAEGYPAGNPTSGFTPLNEGFAGVIHGTPTGGGADLDLYCIDILTETYLGFGYGLGTWDAASVPNVGYVARVLEDYYPHTDEPANLTDLNQKAAAVQAAVWFFSDRYVLNTSEAGIRSTVASIVDTVISEGPLVEPPPPGLTLTPSHLSGTRRALGPFTITTDHPPATVTATGGTMYSNRAGTIEIGDGTTASVPSGQKIWVRSAAGAPTAVLEATSTATVPTGNVYLYDGNSGANSAQKLILAESATLTTTVQATAEFVPSGSLVVGKTIAGDAAGSQAQVVIHVDCDDGVARRDFVIPAGTSAGTTSRTYRHIAAGTTCTVIETSNGEVVGTNVVVTGDGQEVTIPAGGREHVQITDTYTHVSGPASLLVTKTIAGPLAGSQGPVTIQVVCDNTSLSPVFAISPGTSAGSVSQSYDVPAGSVCTVTETADGATGTVTATVSGSGQTVTVPAGEVVPVNVMDVYERTPETSPDVPQAPTGTLRVTKTIAGPAAGQQGRIAILVTCGSPLYDYAFLIPGRARAGSVSRAYPDLPAGSRCTVMETTDGSTAAVTVTATGRHQVVTIPTSGGVVTAHLTDTFFGPKAVSVTG